MKTSDRLDFIRHLDTVIPLTGVVVAVAGLVFVLAFGAGIA